MSTKIKNLSMVFTGTEKQTASDGVLTTYSRNYTVNRSYPSSRTGEPNPKWKEIIRAGGNATTTLSASESAVDWKPAKGTLEYLAYKGFNYPAGSSYISASASGLVNYYPPPAILNHIGNTANEWEANNQAVTLLYKKIRRAHSQAEGGVILGELHKTMMMMARPAMALRNGIGRFIQDCRKRSKGLILTDRYGRKKPSPKLGKVLADTYLEWTFGWMPLVQDVKDSAVALARINYPEYEKTRFRAWGQSDCEMSTSFNTFATPAQIYFDKKTVKTGTVIVVYYGALRETTLETDLAPQAQKIVDLSGFNWANFVPTVWELIPYSFLVDYFTNIGDLLMAASTDTSRVAWLAKVVIKETVDKTVISFNAGETSNPAHFSPTWYKFLGCGGSSGGWTSLYRTVSRGPCQMPFLLPTMTLPNTKQLLNIGALLLGSATGRQWSRSLI